MVGKTIENFCYRFLHWKFFLNSLNLQLYNQPIHAKKIYDIYKFQIFKKMTIFHNILNIKRRLRLDCIHHFQRATSQGYIITS